MTQPRILCVDPDREARRRTVETLASELADLDPVVSEAGSVGDAEAELAKEEDPPDCLITEFELSDGTGLDVIASVRRARPDAGCLLFTTADPSIIPTEGSSAPVTEYLRKDGTRALTRLAELVRATVTGVTQASYPLPQDEADRLEALGAYDLDSPELEAALSRVTNLATLHFDVETASINIIEEHSQEFMACHGAARDWESIDREESICTFTILEDDPVMTVENVQADARFEAVDRLESLGIRSYMGANLRTPAGLTIGTLCVYDDAPRAFTDDEQAFLKTLADVAMDLIEARHRINRLAETTDKAMSSNPTTGGPEGSR